MSQETEQTPRALIPPPAYSLGGDRAWKKEDLPAVIRSLEKQGRAVTRIEAWCVVDGVLMFSVPGLDIDPAEDLDWHAAERENELWSAYVRQCGKEAQSFVAQIDIEAHVDPAHVAHVVFHVDSETRDSIE